MVEALYWWYVMPNSMKSDSAKVEQRNRVAKLPRTVNAPCGRVVSTEVLGREATRDDGEMCGSGACYAVYINPRKVRAGPNPDDVDGSEFVQLLTCEHHREAAMDGEFL